MPETIKVFVSYSHQDANYLEKGSLLGFLKGLEKDGIEFWTDKKIRPGELWDEVIKANIENADIALVLVSQGFLDSEYCQNVEIENFLAKKAHVFPVILSPCDWHRHQWLSSSQFLPSGDQTIEEHFKDEGSRKRLFLQIREQLRERAELIRQSPAPTRPLTEEEIPSLAVGRGENPTSILPLGKGEEKGGGKPFSGKTKIIFCDRLGDDWKRLSDFLEIPTSYQARFDRGDEARGIWDWLWNRGRLADLPDALRHIQCEDLADLF